MSMPSPAIAPTADLTEEIERVRLALDKEGLGKEQRLTLLRRQAALGDLRDALVERARRAAS